MNIYKTVLIILDAALIISAVAVFFSLKKYLQANKDKTVEDASEEINSYIKKFTVMSGLLIALGVVALIVGIFGKMNS